MAPFRSTFKATRSLLGAVLLLGRELVPEWDAWPDTAAATVAIAGASKSQSYAVLERMRDLVPTLVGKQEQSAKQSTKSSETVLRAICEFLLIHPGASYIAAERRYYNEDFRRFVISLCDPGGPGAGMSIAEFASEAGIPLGTYKDWLIPLKADDQDPVSAKAGPDPENNTAVPDGINNIHLQLIATLWVSWKGTFLAFCQMLKTEQRLPYGATFVGDFLQGLGLRKRRRQTPVEASWSGGTFRTLFPGFQWLGDGSSIAIYWGDERLVFNLEAIHDTAADGTVGFDVSDSEDEETLGLAYSDGLETAGSPPLSLTLDNRPSNHSPGAKENLPGTILLRATPGRGQAKAALEGAFGLFQQSMPPLVVEGGTPREMARCALQLIFSAWFRGRNGRPRKRLGGRTPAQAYQDAKPTPEQIKEALAWIRELQQRQERARLTREARLDLVRIQLLNQALAELEIPDPDRRLTLALAGFAQEAIVRGVAVFSAKKELETLPVDADCHGRYLGGIIRQLDIQLELERTSDHNLEQRIRLRDFTLEPLQRSAVQLRAQVPVSALPKAFVDRALEAKSDVAFRLWMREAGNALLEIPAGQREALYKPLTRRIAASFKTDRRRRADLIDRLAHSTAIDSLGRPP